MADLLYFSRPLSQTDRQTVLHNADAFLYLLQTSNPGDYKLGRSSDPERRLDQWNSSCGPGTYTLHAPPLRVSLPVKLGEQERKAFQRKTYLYSRAPALFSHHSAFLASQRTAQIVRTPPCSCWLSNSLQVDEI